MSKRSDPALEGRCEIGKIAGAHGIRGDMLLLPLTDFPERFLEMTRLELSLPGRPLQSLKVTRLEPYEGKNTFFVHLEGVNSRDDAEKLKGASVSVAKDERVALEEDEYWLDDIIGIKVVDASTGESLGRVSEIIRTGSNDVYVVKTLDGKEKPIPATGEAIASIDTAGGTMTVNIPDGLWD